MDSERRDTTYPIHRFRLTAEKLGNLFHRYFSRGWYTLGSTVCADRKGGD